MRKNPWKNPAYRKMMLEKRRKTAKDPKVQKKKSKAMLKLYEDEPERLVKKSRQMKKIWSGRSKREKDRIGKKISKKTAEQMIRQLADPRWRAKLKKVRKEQANRPEEKKRRSRKTKEAWKRKEYRQKVMETRQRTMYSNPEWKRKVGAHQLGKPSWNAGQTKETHPTLAALSKKMKGKIPAWKKYGKYYEGKNGKIWMRSSWEVGYAEWMDGERIEWEYEPASFRVGKGIWKGETYTPDFYIQEEDKWLDVKGYLSKKNAAKIKEFKKRYSDLKFRLVKYKELRTLGVITAGGYKK